MSLKLTDELINMQFGGGCPICKGDNTLTLKGNPFKRKVECAACGSIFVSHFGLISPKWELIDGSSEYLGKILHPGDWKKLRNGEIDKTEVENRDKQIKEFAGTEKIMIYLSGILVVVCIFVILIVSIFLDYSTLMAASKSLMLVGVILFILACVIIGISLGYNRFIKKY